MAAGSMPGSPQTASEKASMTAHDTDVVKVWDPLVRFFHWALVAGIAITWLTGDEWDRIHEWTGYGIGALLAVRIVWGFIGTKYARFSQFVKGPRETLAYIGRILRGRAERHIGHNPAGAAMILALIATISITVLTGWMMTLDAFWGAEWLEDLHEFLANSVLVLAGFHVAGVIHASITHRENLVRAMFTGCKPKK